MPLKPAPKIRRRGAYIIKAAETRSQPVERRIGIRRAVRPAVGPSADDKRLAAALRRMRQT